MTTTKAARNPVQRVAFDISRDVPARADIGALRNAIITAPP